MRRLSVLFVVLAAAIAVAPAQARAFTRATRVEIARRAVTLMPPALARQLRRHARDVEAGVAESARPITPPGATAGDAGARLTARVEAVARLVNDRAPMRQVARAFGDLAGIAMDLSFALNTAPEDPRARRVYADFSRYVERKLARMSLTFAGHDDPQLSRGDVAGFAKATADAARRDYQGILNSYFPAGRRALPEDFDDRSVAFAAASLEASLALTTTARCWLYAWRQADGDLTGTPSPGGDPPPAPPAAGNFVPPHPPRSNRRPAHAEERP